MIASGTFQIEAPRAELARMLRCNESELHDALLSLKLSEVGIVTLHGNGNVTLINRRRLNEHNARKNGRSRVASHRLKHKCNTYPALYSASASDSQSGKGESGETPADEPFPEVAVDPGIPRPLPPGAGATAAFLHAEIGKAYQRDPLANWPHDEHRALLDLCRVDGVDKEWYEIKAYHAKDPGYRRQTVRSLLENWQCELDKARGFDTRKKGEQNANNPRNNAKNDRNAGTYNEGRASQYRNAAVSGAKKVPDVPDVGRSGA